MLYPWILKASEESCKVLLRFAVLVVGVFMLHWQSVRQCQTLPSLGNIQAVRQLEIAQDQSAAGDKIRNVKQASSDYLPSHAVVIGICCLQLVLQLQFSTLPGQDHERKHILWEMFLPKGYPHTAPWPDCSEVCGKQSKQIFEDLFCHMEIT